MRPKLEIMFDDVSFGVGALDWDTGIMITHRSEAVEFLFLEYPGKCTVYHNLYDEGEPPFRNILVTGEGETKEIAEANAVRKLEQEAYGNMH